jgi:hypothetical protein
MSSRTASCSCGQLRIAVEGEPRGVGICNCLACQRRTGSVFAALASFKAPFKVFGSATEYVRVGDQGARFNFRFCPVCGTTVFHTEEGRDDSIAVAVGAFADPTFPAPHVSVYDCRRHPWVHSCRQVRKYSRRIRPDRMRCAQARPAHPCTTPDPKGHGDAEAWSHRHRRPVTSLSRAYRDWSL